MTPIARYRCDICQAEYDSLAAAEACEAQGFPEPMPFLPWGREIPAFGNDCVEWAKLEDVWVQCDDLGRHEWRCETNLTVTYNGDARPEWFDPRRGSDACRYGWTAEDLAVWEATLRAYGFTEADVNPTVMGWIRKAREKVR